MPSQKIPRWGGEGERPGESGRLGALLAEASLPRETLLVNMGKNSHKHFSFTHPPCPRAPNAKSSSFSPPSSLSSRPEGGTSPFGVLFFGLAVLLRHHPPWVLRSHLSSMMPMHISIRRMHTASIIAERSMPPVFTMKLVAFGGFDLTCRHSNSNRT